MSQAGEPICWGRGPVGCFAQQVLCPRTTTFHVIFPCTAASVCGKRQIFNFPPSACKSELCLMSGTDSLQHSAQLTQRKSNFVKTGTRQCCLCFATPFLFWTRLGQPLCREMLFQFLPGVALILLCTTPEDPSGPRGCLFCLSQVRDPGGKL